MVKFLKWRALHKLGCCLSRLVSGVTSLRLARFPSATRNITLLPSAWGLARVDAMPRSLLYQHARWLLEGALQRGFTSVRDASGAD